MNVLITGASGFIGRGIIKKLINKKNIHILAGVRSKIKTLKVRQLVIGNIQRNTNFRNVLVNIDVVIHVAGIAHVREKKNINISENIYDEVNHLGTLNLAQQSFQAGVKKFIFLSSIKVNGEFTKKNTMFKGSDQPMPQDDYAKSKLNAEKSLVNNFINSEMKLVILRLPLVYGENVKANFLDLIKLIKENIFLPFGAINNKRSFIYLENLVDIIYQCIHNNNVNGKVYLISDGDDFSTSEIIQIIKEGINTTLFNISIPITILKIISVLLGKKQKFEKITQSLVIDNSEIKKDLDWIPTFTGKKGILKTCDWFKVENNLK
tara:strand:+ start:938 stop:1900 length:963 start_codon:yes stop_codon:yes gene_type:complete